MIESAYTLNKEVLDKIYNELHERSLSESINPLISDQLEKACVAISKMKANDNSEQKNFFQDLKNLYTAWYTDSKYSMAINDLNEVLSHFLDLSLLQGASTVQTSRMSESMDLSSEDLDASPPDLYAGLPEVISTPEIKGIFDFKPTEEEWNKAEEFLKDKPDGSKFEKKKTQEKYSFIKSDGVIYAISNKSCFDFDLRGGNFGVIKKGLRRTGKEVAIKIESRALRDEKSHAYRSGKMLGLIISQALREDPDMNLQLIGKPKVKTSQKLYTILEWAGDDLSSVLKKELEGTIKITDTQRRLIVLRCCLAVQAANDLGIIHGDLKPENIMITINENDIKIRLVDIDLARILPEGKNEIKSPIGGTLSYVAPELFNQQIYSTASDSYALGIMFLLNLNLGYQEGKISALVKNNFLMYVQNQFDKLKWTRGIIEIDPIKYLKNNGIKVDKIQDINIIERLLSSDRWERAALSEIIVSYCEELLQQTDINKELRDEIEKIHEEFKSRAAKERTEKNLSRKPQETSYPTQLNDFPPIPDDMKDLYSGIPITSSTPAEVVLVQEDDVKKIFDNLAEEYRKMKRSHSTVGQWMREKAKMETSQTEGFLSKLPTQLQDFKDALVNIMEYESIPINEKASLIYLKLISIRDEIEKTKDTKNFDPEMLKLISEKAEQLNTLFKGELEKSSRNLNDLNSSFSKSSKKNPGKN